MKIFQSAKKKKKKKGTQEKSESNKFYSNLLLKHIKAITRKDNLNYEVQLKGST